MALTRHKFNRETILAKIETVQRLASAPVSAEHNQILKTLLEGNMEPQGLMPWSSNYTFLVKIVADNDISLLGIYKPGDGERPLWDFPDQTLSLREFTSYLISQVLGWPKIPPTIIRDGTHGIGSVQHFVDAEYEAHYFNMRDMPDFMEDFRQMALFDYIANNADRKGGHCLKGIDDQIWAIDHGLTFHTQPKLRTVIWEFSDEQIAETYLQDLCKLQELMAGQELCQVLADLISPREIDAFKDRINLLVSTGQFPALAPGRNVPYPPI